MKTKSLRVAAITAAFAGLMALAAPGGVPMLEAAAWDR